MFVPAIARYPIRVLIWRQAVYIPNVSAGHAVERLPGPGPDLIMMSAVIETERGLSHSRAQRLRRFFPVPGNHDLRGRDGRGRLA